jgi:FSR family fosmidomycin resistance protein-like MFS transporter
VVAFAGMFVLSRVGRWYAARLSVRKTSVHVETPPNRFSPKTIAISLAVLLVLIFSKFIYLAAMTNYYTFFLMQKFGVSVQSSQFYLFLFLAAVAAGTMAGGPIGDKIGRKAVIWVSILGMSPFSLLLPHANLFWTAVLSVPIGFIMASAFPAILVYATELLPSKVGLIAGLFFGLAFGIGGIGSAMLGKLADLTSISFVMLVCGFLPLIGLLTGFLPDLKGNSE